MIAHLATPLIIGRLRVKRKANGTMLCVHPDPVWQESRFFWGVDCARSSKGCSGAAHRSRFAERRFQSRRDARAAFAFKAFFSASFRTVGSIGITTMTWHTPSGDRYLVGEEAELVRDSIATMVQELASCRETEEEPWAYGVTLFDELSWQQQLAVLNQLATNLLQETGETLELSGVNEAGVAAVYQNITQQIELEIELHPVSPAEYRCRWRQATLDAFRENENDDVIRQETLAQESDGESIFDIETDCLDLQRWQWLVELLADRVLWDRDFEMVNEMIDAPPERAAAMRAALGITPGYYTAIAPDPTDKQVDALFESIERITRARPR